MGILTNRIPALASASGLPALWLVLGCSGGGSQSLPEDGGPSSDAADTDARPPGEGTSLRFFGNGVDDIDRLKIRIDDPAVAGDPGPPVDVGDEDFTIEWWIKGERSDNQAGTISCGATNDWIHGNIVVDRDRFNQDRAWGMSLAEGRPTFGVLGPDAAGALTICGDTDVLDGQWHHLAIQRRRSDGHLWIFVDGSLDAEGDGPDGDVSYPDDAVPQDFCGGPCVGSDPFIVIAAEKHDAGSEFPSFNGWMDEMRLSNSLRYANQFQPPASPFTPDAQTAGLYHFDEGTGETITDSSGASGGPSHGTLRFGERLPDRYGPTTPPSDAAGLQS